MAMLAEQLRPLRSPSEFLAQSLKRIKPSATMAVTDKARALKAAGRDVIGLGAGEPDFDTPDNIKEAAIKAIGAARLEIHRGRGHGRAQGGGRRASSSARTVSTTSRAQIIVGTGGKQVLYNALMATLNPGDEVIIPAPYLGQLSRHGAARRRRAGEVVTAMERGFKMTPRGAGDARSRRAPSGCIFNSPSNPTGAAYTQAPS